MKVGIISGRYPGTQFDSAVNHKLYADKYGYDYIHCNWPTKSLNPYHNKIHYILTHMDMFDYVVWIDDDAFFFDFDKDIMEYAPKGDSFLSACRSPSYKALKTYMSSGQFVLKTGIISQQFLEKALEQDLTEVKEWWTDEMGYFSNGDQDAFIFLFLTDEKFKSGLNLYEYQEFNSRPENLFDADVHKPLVLHFTGKPEIKWENYMKVQKELNFHSSLCSSEILKKYGIKFPKTLTKTFNQKVKSKLRSWLKV